jgi:hypothetical protein
MYLFPILFPFKSGRQRVLKLKFLKQKKDDDAKKKSLSFPAKSFSELFYMTESSSFNIISHIFFCVGQEFFLFSV